MKAQLSIFVAYADTSIASSILFYYKKELKIS